MQRVIFLALGLMFLSCSDNNTSDEPDGNGRRLKVEFAVGPTISRTTMDESYNSAFVKGDAIGVFATGGAQASNVKHSVTEGNKLVAATAVSTDGTGDACNFYAYYPYDANNGSAVSHVVSSDQSTESEFYGSDFVTARAENKTVTQGQAVKLDFSHRMALVELSLALPEGAEKPLGAKITNCLVQGQWDYVSDQFAASGGAASVAMLDAGNAGMTYRAMVPEQTIAKGTSLFAIETLPATYTFTAEQDIELKSNHVKKFKVGINAAAEEAGEFSPEISISSWQVDDDVVAGQGVEKTANYIVKEDFEGDVALKAAALTFVEDFPTQEGWIIGAIKNMQSTIKDKPGNDGRELELVCNSQNKQWYMGMLGYVTFNPAPGLYRMRAKVTSRINGDEYSVGCCNFYMSAALVTSEVDSDGSDDMVAYLCETTSPDGSMPGIKYEAPTVDTYSLDGEYIIITADVDLTQCRRFDGSNINKLSGTVTAPTQEMYDMAVFFVNGDPTCSAKLYIDSITVELLEEK
ncbi:MAG: fimbrillin family protein [Roseburia sp.]|nr:fimbrillin family protein [Roseburia sp.]